MPGANHLKHKHFTASNKSRSQDDARYWESAVKALLELYKTTDCRDEANKEQKALAMAKLAGIGLAMYQHFTNGVDSLDSTENHACLTVGVTTYELGMKHGQRLEETFKKEQS